tara:strand:- start:23910 stop:24104 length:195 start_codon:yes stop_codon:yes gene_type:complete
MINLKRRTMKNKIKCLQRDLSVLQLRLEKTNAQKNLIPINLLMQKTSITLAIKKLNNELRFNNG